MDIIINKTVTHIDCVISGPIDMKSIKKFKQSIYTLSSKKIDIIINLSDVDYIDSSGIGVLLGLHQILKKNDNKLLLKKITPRIRTILKQCSLLKYFHEIDE